MAVSINDYRPLFPECGRLGDERKDDDPAGNGCIQYGAHEEDSALDTSLWRPTEIQTDRRPKNKKTEMILKARKRYIPPKGHP